MQEQLYINIQSRVVMDSLIAWWFFNGYKISSTTNNLYATEWKKSTRNLLYAGDMSNLKKTLQTFEVGELKEDDSKSRGEMA